ncbi:MAG TPA: ribosome silencing factor [Desulfobacteraceae bacterium]|nr:ribosome silencing factor [Desulfobacteraceae bacterium]
MNPVLEKARLCLKFIEERKAVNPVLFRVAELTSITDYFLVAGGRSTRQVQAISRHLQRRLKEQGKRPFGVEGETDGNWILLDYGDVVIHVFYEPFREFYDLEGLWADAPRVPSEAEDGNNTIRD